MPTNQSNQKKTDQHNPNKNTTPTTATKNKAPEYSYDKSTKKPGENPKVLPKKN